MKRVGHVISSTWVNYWSIGKTVFWSTKGIRVWVLTWADLWTRGSRLCKRSQEATKFFYFFFVQSSTIIPFGIWGFLAGTIFWLRYMRLSSSLSNLPISVVIAFLKGLWLPMKSPTILLHVSWLLAVSGGVSFFPFVSPVSTLLLCWLVFVLTTISTNPSPDEASNITILLLASTLAMETLQWVMEVFLFREYAL